MKAAPFNLKAAGVKLTARSNIQKQDTRNNIQKVDTSKQEIIKGTSQPEPHSQKWLELRKAESELKRQGEEEERKHRQWRKQIGTSYSEGVEQRYSQQPSDAELERILNL